MSAVAEATEATFDAFLGSPKLLLVKFWAPWCGPCRILAPTVDKLAAEMADSLVAVAVNTDADAGLAARFRVTGNPSLLLFKGGQQVDRIAGVVTERQLRDMIARQL